MRLPALLAAAAACWASVGTPRPAGAAVTLPATRYSEESADMGSYSIEIAIGRPPQRVRARIDTGSGSVVAPTSRTDCPECSTPSSWCKPLMLGGQRLSGARSSFSVHAAPPGSAQR